MQKTEKERVVAELTEKLRAVDSLIVADYRGLTNVQLQELRARLRAHGARFSVVKNTLTRRAAEAAGADSLLALLDGPTGIAFVEASGDPVAVAKALSDTARDTRILALRGGILQGAPMSAEDVESLGKLPPLDQLRGQVVGVIVAPLTQLVGLLTAPLRDLVGLLDARIAQLEERGDASASAAAADDAAPEAPAEAEEAPVEPEVAPAVEASAEEEQAPSTDETNETHTNEEE